MNKILKKISAAVQLILLAPVKLPAKAMNVIKYVALGLGILEKVIAKGDNGEDPMEVNRKEGGKV